MLRRGFATQQRPPAQPGAKRPAAKAAAAKPSASAAASRAAALAAAVKAKAKAKAKQDLVIEKVEKPLFKVRDVFPASPFVWCKQASYKDIMKKFREADRKLGQEFKPRQAVIEMLLQKAETKAQLRRVTKVYLRDFLEHPLLRDQKPRQRIIDVLFRRYLEVGDNRFAMHILRDPAFRVWPSPSLLQRAVHQWMHTKDGNPRTLKAVAGVWSLYQDKSDLVATPPILSSGLRALLAAGPAALPSAMRVAARHAKGLQADHYVLLYRAALAGSDVPALQTLLATRQQHLPDAAVRANVGLLKVELEARLATDAPEQLAAAVAHFDALADEPRARLLRGLLVDAALTPGLAARLARLWAASLHRAAPSEALKPLAELLAKLDAPDALRSSPLLQPLVARAEANVAKRSAKTPADKPAAAAAAEKPAVEQPAATQ